jgi:hypothetical protein
MDALSAWIAAFPWYSIGLPDGSRLPTCDPKEFIRLLRRVDLHVALSDEYTVIYEQEP